jgi:hypothetical protein
VSATEHPDAALIAIGVEAVPLLAKFYRHTRAFFALPSRHPDLHRVAHLADPADARLDRLMEAAKTLRAGTTAGMHVKALLLGHAMRMEFGNGVQLADGDTHTAELSRSLFADLARETKT